MIQDVRAKGYRVVAGGVVLGGGWPGSPLDQIFQSHPACHAAEGELYRAALARACRLQRLAVTGMRERDLYSAGSRALRVSDAVLRQRVAELGREQGPPWRQDQKSAALVAWLALLARRS